MIRARSISTGVPPPLRTTAVRRARGLPGILIAAVLVVLIAAAALVLAAAFTPASACSCAEPSPPLVALAHSDAVFWGRVVAVASLSVHEIVATFEVQACWKGAAGPTIDIITNHSSAACGLEFDVGQEWLVYASGEPGSLRTGLCSRTLPLAAAGPDLEALDAPTCTTTAVTPETWATVKRLYRD